MKIESTLVQIKESQNEILKTRSIDVNVRLYCGNKDYKKIILGICKHMRKTLQTKFSDYRALSGISGANVGIPLNIIAYIESGKVTYMINPNVIRMSNETTTTKSNCGSLNLKTDCKVRRRNWIEVSYYSVSGKHKTKVVSLKDYGGTIQHEIDHNRGVLITDTNRHL